MDARTTFALSAVFMLLNGGVLGLLHRELSPELRPCAADWRVGTLLGAGGMVLLGAQSPAVAWLMLPSANACLLVGLALYSRALRRFDGIPDRWWIFVPAAVGTAGVTYFLLVEPLVWVRVMVASLCGVVTLWAGAHSLIRNRGRRSDIGRVGLVGLIVVICAFMVARVFYFSVHRHDVGSIVAPDHFVNFLSALALSILPIIGTTAFLAMALQRLRAELAQRASELGEKSAALAAVVRSREDAERIARHDLKTPLASIAATPALLRALRQDPQEQEALLNLIEGSAKRALNMVNLSLDLHRMEQGQYVFTPVPTDLRELALNVVQDLKPHALSKRVTLQVLGSSESLWAEADALLSYSCVANLAKNAVEAASDGSTVTFGLSHGSWATLEIHNDTAVPLPLRARFFEKYATHGKAGGSGLGAYSSRLIAEVQRGQLEMRTSEEDGTTLTLRLRPYPVSGTAADSGAPMRNPGPREQASSGRSDTDLRIALLRVLVVDDDAYNRKVLCSHLATLGVQADTAINGRGALEYCWQRRPDLIFMDIHMPVMDGLATLQEIRSMQSARRQVSSTVAAFSSEVEATSKAHFHELGFDATISKPAVMDDLRRLLSTCAHPSSLIMRPDLEVLTPVRPPSAVMPDMAKFIASRFHLLDQLAAAAQEGEDQRVRALAHQLNGSLAMYGFDLASAVCAKLERSSQRVSEAPDAIQQVSQHLRHAPILAAHNESA